MIDFHLHYRVSFFTSTQDFSPSPDVFSRILDLFRERGFIPTTFHEFSPSAPTPQLRIKMASPNGEWAINFPSIRIDIEKLPTDLKGSNMGAIQPLFTEVGAMFKRINEAFPRKGTRLAFEARYLLSELPKEKLDSSFLKLFVPINSFHDPLPFEWGLRMAQKRNISFGAFSESVNLVTQMARISGHYANDKQLQEFDRIEVRLDINTDGNNSESRFSIDSIEQFGQAILPIHDSVMSDIKAQING